jgi:endogenous inhibitor of DNA gyrase (YacG/DUF329 family)
MNSDKKKVSEDRDLSITKKCDACGIAYHPRRNSYQATSRFCSAKCSRKGLRGTFALRR